MSLASTTSRLAAPRRAAPPPAAKTCDLCGGQQFDLVAQRDRLGDVLHTGMCLRCGLVCHMTIPSEEELARFYALDYRQAYHGESTPSPRRVARAWRNGQRLVRRLSPFVSAGQRVLEIGAGIGCTVKQFELQGFDARGIEPNVGFQEYSARQLRARVERGDLFELPESGDCDLVLLVHVIEHFRSPRRALEKIRGLLRPSGGGQRGGLLYVECPNLAAPFARPGQWFHYAHIHNFTPATLRMLAERCGFAVERLLAGEREPNLQMLLRRCDTPTSPPRIDPEGLRQTQAGLARYNALTYHLRWSYLRERAGKVAGLLGEHLSARRFVRKLVDRCQHPHKDAGVG